jgi:hypothetical protein
MALVATTLSGAITVNDTSILVASATSVAAGRWIKIDGEMMQVANSYVTASTTVPVLRGKDGTAVAAHPTSAKVIHGAAADFTPASTEQNFVSNPLPLTLQKFSYSASGAVSPVQGIHVLNGTSTLTMTLANPDTSQDGQLIIVGANGKAAHTVTIADGVGAGSTVTDVITFSTAYAGAIMLIALGGYWNGFGVISANTPVGSPTVG